MRKFNSFQLKFFMMCLMVLDHLSFIPNFIPYEVEAIFHLITRPVALWFTFALVEGFIYTRNRYAYCLRLFGFALFMMGGSFILQTVYHLPITPLFPNIIFAFAMTCAQLILLYHHDDAIDKVPMLLRILSAFCIYLLTYFYAEGSFLIPTFAFIFYNFKDNAKQRDLSLALFSLVMLLSALSNLNASSTVFTIMHREWFFVSVIPFLYLYNGKPGPRNQLTKYMFYIFYPLHIWILTIIAALLNT